MENMLYILLAAAAVLIVYIIFIYNSLVRK